MERVRALKRIARGDLDDDVLGLILERIDSQVSLVRAAAVCKRWRRIVADAAFLRRFRSLHAPDVAGDFHNDTPAHEYEEERKRVGRVVFVPALPSIDARHFALDFLPGMVDPSSPQHWKVLDSRGSLLLMRRFESRLATLPLGNFPDLTVCEPLTRRYQKVMAVPAGFNDTYHYTGAYLVDGNSAGGDQAGCRIGVFNFRVMCLCLRLSDLASVDADAGQASWSEKTIGQMGQMIIVGCAGRFRHFYSDQAALTVFDGRSGEFYSSPLPLSRCFRMSTCQVWITEGRDGKLRIFAEIGNRMQVFVRLDDGAWTVENRAVLSELTRGLQGYRPSFFMHGLDLVTRSPGFVILSPRNKEPWLINTSENKEPWFFSIQLDTMKVVFTHFSVDA